MASVTLEINKRENDAGGRIIYEGRLRYPPTVREQSFPFTFSVPTTIHANFLNSFRQFYSEYFYQFHRWIKTKGSSGVTPENHESFEQFNLERYGQDIYHHILTYPDLRERLFDHPVKELNIVTNDLAMPWELLCNEEKFFLALRHSIARIFDPAHLPFEEPLVLFTNDELLGPLNILFVANPSLNPERSPLFDDMTYTEWEVEQIASTLIREGIISQESEILTRERASIREIEYRYARKKYHVLHYSGHNEYNPFTPEGNGLILAGRELLTPPLCMDIFRKNFPDLIFMNSCSTAPGFDQTDSPYSFIESFCRIGIPAFVGTLWKIEPESSAQFAINFYKNFAMGLSIGRALQEAKKWSYADKKDRCGTWAAFILYGNQNIHIDPKSVTVAGGPYKFLDHYTEKDQNIFRGRQEEIVELARDLASGQYPIMILSGDSGVGKTSLLHAGVKPFLEYRYLCDVVIKDSRYDALQDSLKEKVSEKLGQPRSLIGTKRLSEFLDKLELKRTLVVVLDQFERFFLPFFDATIRDRFFEELVECVKKTSLNVGFLLSLRADFSPHISYYLDKKLKHALDGYIDRPFLKKLSMERAKEAIQEPIEIFNSDLMRK